MIDKRIQLASLLHLIGWVCLLSKSEGRQMTINIERAIDRALDLIENATRTIGSLEYPLNDRSAPTVSELQQSLTVLKDWQKCFFLLSEAKHVLHETVKEMRKVCRTIDLHDPNWESTFRAMKNAERTFERIEGLENPRS